MANKRLKSPKSFSKPQLLVFAIAFGLIGYLIFRAFAAPNPNLTGDLNGDNTVNIQDLSILLSNYNTSNSSADINNDNTVNILDLSALLSHYGQSYSGGGGTSSLYGTPWQADGLANLEIGKSSGRQISIRFKAKQNETLTNVRFYLIFRAICASGYSGYYCGNGGQVKVQLQTDTNGFPSGTSLASYTITDPLSLGSGGAFPNVPLSASLTGGQTYHIVFTNPASDPINNWVSLDDLSGQTPQAADPNLVITWKSSGTDSWTVNSGHTPIVELTFADGSHYGQQYIDVRSSSGLVSISGSTTASESFTPSQARTISKVNALTSKSGSPSALNFTLYENGSQVAASSVPASSVSTSYGWVLTPMAYNLKSGASYKLTLSASTGTYSIYPYQKGTGYGFSDPFPDGSEAPGFDYPIYFSP